MVDDGCWPNIEYGYANTFHPNRAAICLFLDFKNMLLDPLSMKGPVYFRRKVHTLTSEIRARCPNASVVFPAIPVGLSPESPLNVFPLRVSLDFVVNLFDIQKKWAAQQINNPHVLQFISRIKPDAEYSKEFKGKVVTAGDGVHPNDSGQRWWGIHIGENVRIE